MLDTARLHGLTIGSGIDDCLDVPKSTRAAARYLRELHARFGDWSLALVANHIGEAVIQSAVLKSGSKDFGLLSSSPRGSGGLTTLAGTGPSKLVARILKESEKKGGMHGTKGSRGRCGWHSFEDFGDRPRDAAEGCFRIQNDTPTDVQLGEEGR